MKDIGSTNTKNIDLQFLQNIEGLVSNLSDVGHISVNSSTFHKVQESNKNSVLGKDELEFIESWQNLELDRFISDEGVYRTRKHATFTINGEFQSCSKNDYQLHYQTTDYNTLNGGVKRYYKEIDLNTNKTPVFNSLLQLAYSIFDNGKMKNWYVEAHQFRVKAHEQSNGKPTPEGVHRDGVDYVLMAMINKDNVTGGITTIYDSNKNPLTAFELENFLDIAMVNDHTVYHGVSEIQPRDNNGNKVGFRDMLVITFKESNK